MITLWTVSLVIEAALLLFMQGSRRDSFSAFRLYLGVDLACSVFLYIMALAGSGIVYDSCWRLAQLALLGFRSLVVMDVYVSMAFRNPYWRFSDVANIPLAGCAALVFRLFQDTPVRWPWSNLEQVFLTVATFDFFLSMLILTVIVAKHRRPLVPTENWWHGLSFAAYLGASSICYFGLSAYPVLSDVLLWCSVIFYSARLVMSLWFAPSDEPTQPQPRIQRGWAEEQQQ